MSELQLKLLYSEDFISSQIQRVADEINRDYQGREIFLVGVLKGSFLFVADLVRHLKPSTTVDFVRLASYGSETQSSGIVEMRKDLELPVRDRDVLIVEDIVDSGYTLDFLYNLLLLRNPASIRICTLIDKKFRRAVDRGIDYVGIPMEKDGFIIGYGLDYDERYRNLPDIYLVENR